MPDTEELNIRLKLAQIDHELAKHGQRLPDRDIKQQEVKFAPWQIATTLLGGAAACFAAGAAFVAVLFNAK